MAVDAQGGGDGGVTEDLLDNPGGYTLDAALRAWIAEGTSDAVGEAAAAAYHRYQKCGLRAARRLFWGAP